MSAAPEPTSVVTGRAAPTPSQVAAAAASNRRRNRAVREAVLRDCLSADEVVALLGRLPDALVVLSDGDETRFPAWQFDPLGPGGLLDGLADVLGALPDGAPTSIAWWCMTPKVALDDQSPVQALREGAVARVIAQAQAVCPEAPRAGQ